LGVELVFYLWARGTLGRVCDGLTPGCGGQGAYGPAAGVQGWGCCGAGCGDCEGVGGSGDHIHLFI